MNSSIKELPNRLRTSHVVQARDFHSMDFRLTTEELGEDFKIHRKLWEYVRICQIAREFGIEYGLALGFGCGQEPIPLYLARLLNCFVVATDQPNPDSAWVDSNQYLHSVEGIIDNLDLTSNDIDLAYRLHYAKIDMNDIPEIYKQGKFDLTWSCGSLEHIGGLQQGLDFIVEQMKCVCVGGLSIHTTELNYEADSKDTLEALDLSLYTREHIEELGNGLADNGSTLRVLDMTMGDSVEDEHVDTHPYQDQPHLKLKIQDWVSTSIVLVINKDTG